MFAEDDHGLWYTIDRKPKRGGKGGGSENSDGSGSSLTLSEDDDDGQDGDKNGTQTPLRNKPGTPDDDDESESLSMNNMQANRSDLDEDDISEQWKAVSQRMQTDLETISKQKGVKAGNLVQNLQALNREKYDYSEFLRKFAVYGEEMKTDEDSFDYNFYCYGLEQYGNAAIIEPLEYKDVKKVREFVIAIDTSGSVQGKTVQMFLQKTFNILKQEESFFSKVNIHIIQCDAAVQEDAKLTTTEEFDEYLKTLELRGFGGTDFRPVFRYVNNMAEKGEFEDLRGLIYFTDGCGTFPEKQPPYKTAFVFLDDEYNNYDVPVWAMKLILETKDITDKP
jgi:predicted metal-dependent peptidase